MNSIFFSSAEKKLRDLAQLCAADEIISLAEHLTYKSLQHFFQNRTHLSAPFLSAYSFQPSQELLETTVRSHGSSSAQSQ